MLLLPKKSRPAKEYDPMAEPGLFRVFLGLKPTPDAIVGFANAYGPLGLEDGRYAEDWENEHLTDTLAGCQAEIRTMKRAWTAWVAEKPVKNALNEGLRGRVTVEFGTGLEVVPLSLIGALWLQFAQAVSGQRAFHPCDACGRLIELHPTANRADRRYCGDACRARAYRKRHSVRRL
jgi:hypothetical protein